ncbi:NUDIX hydrolase [Lichenicola sp.]|uniref:NUDIX hydrolase n=1 Tax=Lichenicola sp. TaxID=2804529 RepID=UPI003B0087DA
MTLDPGVTVRVAPSTQAGVAGTVPSLPADLEADVESIWSAERARRPVLFNGRVFSADTITPSLITGHWTEYRCVLAQIRKPSLYARLKVRPLAVNGLVECADGLVLGRRHADAVYLPGRWQAAPAGNVEARAGDDVNLIEQVHVELREELGLLPNMIDLTRPVAAIEHTDTHVVDVGLLLRTPLSFAEIARHRQQAGNDEYDLLQVVPTDALGRFMRENASTLLPSAHILIECWQRDRR